MAGVSGVDGINRGNGFSISKAVKPGNFPEGTTALIAPRILTPRMSHHANVVQLTS
jgi:hypothetical protein